MADKIKVLQCTAVLNVGGVENMIMNLYRHIDRDSFAYDFITGGGDDHYYYEDEVGSLGGHVYRVPKRSISMIGHHREFYRIVREGHYDVLHFHDNNSYFVALEVIVARLAGAKKIIVHSHSTSDWRQTEKEHKWLNAIAYRILKVLATRRLACSVPAAQWLFGSARGVEIFPLPVKTADYLYDKVLREQLRAEYGVTGRRVYAHVGRFSEEKNHKFLIECFRIIAAADPDAVLFLMGDGPKRAETEALVKGTDIESRVIFFGNVNDVGAKLRAADIFVLPSLYEGFPTAVLEAQAAGLKCLVSDRVTSDICITDLVRQMPLEAGAEAWAKALMETELTAPEDKRTANAAIASQYDIDTVTRKLEEMYRSLAGR